MKHRDFPIGQVKQIIARLLMDIEEEDVSIGLYNIFCQNEDALDFFSDKDRGQVVETLKRLSRDSKRHKVILETIISRLGAHLGK